MIYLMYILLEAITVIICLHALYGKKVFIDLYTILFLTVDCIMMAAIEILGVNQNLSLLVYPIIIIYCILEFNSNIMEAIINTILFVVIISCVQLMVSIIFSCVRYFETLNGDIHAIIINLFVLVVIITIYNKVNLHFLSLYFQRKEIFIICTLILECGVVFALLFNYKSVQGMLPGRYIILALLLIFIIILCINGLLYKMKYQDEKSELEVYKTYSAVFEELITDIRVKQHEFDNHINALCNLHYVCKDYDELVWEQSQYAKDVVNDNKFNKLLSSGNPVLSGFLYGRFRSIDNLGIHISYRFCVSEFQCKIPIYLIIELIGNLLNNATDALKRESGEKLLYVECIEEEKIIKIVVQNTSRKFSYEEMAKFFEKGYSSKGEQRGLGLYHVKKICNDYHINIFCENREINDKNWIAFELHIKKQ